MKTILSHKVTQFITTVIILLSAYIIIYPPNIEIFEQTSEYAPILMFAMLFISFMFLVFNQRRLMFIGMMATAFIAFFLKIASNDNLVLPQQNLLPKLKVAHFNLSSFNRQKTNIGELILKINADIISFQEFTPDWAVPLGSALKFNFPHSYKMTRVDPFGMAIFSTKTIQVNTFKYKNIPNVVISVENQLGGIDIVSSYIPSVYPNPNLKRQEHLDLLVEQVNSKTNPVIALGDYHSVYWDKELTKFTTQTGLKNSRRSTALSYFKPYDHIFFSDKLECVQFDEIYDAQQNHLGIVGTYQMKSKI